MSRVLFVLVSFVALASIACSGSQGTGGSGGSIGNGGSGGGTNCECTSNAECTIVGQKCQDCACVDGSTQCIPDCSAGNTCVSGTCEADYTLRFTRKPDATGPIFDVLIEARPYPGRLSLKPSEITVLPTYKGNAGTAATVATVDGQDNVFVVHFDYSGDRTGGNDQTPLDLQIYPTKAPANLLTGHINIDNKAPSVSPDRLPAMGFKRNEQIYATAAIDDLHMTGGSAMGRLVGPGELDPVEPNPLEPTTLEGWVPGVQQPGSDRLWSFTLDQRHTTLTTLSGSLAVWIWTRDQYGNTGMSHRTEADFKAKVSRDAWTGDMPNPMIAGIKGGGGGAGGNGAGITNAPAIDKNGKVVVMVSGTKDNFDLFDPMTGVRTAFFAQASGDPLAPVIGASGNYYVASFDHFDLYKLDQGSLTRINTCVTTNHQGITSPPALLKPGNQELVAYTRSDGTLAQVAVDTPSTPPTCTTEVATRILNAANTSPALTVNGAGETIAVVGGQRPDTLSTFVVGADGSFTARSTYVPQAFDVLRDVPVAIDHNTIYAAPRFRPQASAFQYGDAFDGTPTERSFIFENAENDKVGPPIVSAHAVVFPTTKGLRALPRFGPWAQDAVLSPDEVFKAPAVAGEGDILYAISYTGKLYALKYQETPTPTLTVLWSLQVGGMNETFSASPTLTCSGVLVMGSEISKVHALIVDSRGLDPQAPWPKILHDVGNTGNASTSLACP